MSIEDDGKPSELLPGHTRIKNIGRLTIDENNRLYWDNKLLQTESVVVLSSKQAIWAIAVSIFTVLAAMLSAYYAKDSRDYSGISALYAMKTFEQSLSSPERAVKLNDETLALLREVSNKIDAIELKASSIDSNILDKFRKDQQIEYKMCGPLSGICAWFASWIQG